jgi:hypothetical protein
MRTTQITSYQVGDVFQVGYDDQVFDWAVEAPEVEFGA